MIVYRNKAFPSGEGGPAQAGSDEAGMHPDQYALKEPRTEKGKQDNGFTVYYGWHKPSVRTNLIRPSVRAGAPSPKGKAWALPRHSNHPTINDHLQYQFHSPNTTLFSPDILQTPSCCIRQIVL